MPLKQKVYHFTPMNVWGKLIGFATGFALKGPEGSLVGAIAGHLVDVYIGWAERHVGSTQTFNDGRDRRNPGSRYLFTVAVVSLGAKLAKVDGPVTKAEIAAFKEVFRVPPEEVQNVGQLFDRARQDAAGYEEFANQLSLMFQANHGTLDEIVACLFHVAVADGPLNKAEVGFIFHVCRIFGFSESYFQRRLEENTGATYATGGNESAYEQKSRAAAGMHAAPDPYVVLGVQSTATDKDIKLRYRKLVRENHPDSLQAAGSSTEAVKKATAKLARINAAYDQVLKERQIN